MLLKGQRLNNATILRYARKTANIAVFFNGIAVLSRCSKHVLTSQWLQLAGHLQEYPASGVFAGKYKYMILHTTELKYALY